MPKLSKAQQKLYNRLANGGRLVWSYMGPCIEDALGRGESVHISTARALLRRGLLVKVDSQQFGTAFYKLKT